MVTLVDGHNALHRLGIRTGRHEGDRRELLVRLREVDSSAEVYFDARHAPVGLPGGGREEGLVVHYCRREEADRAILDRVRAARRPGDVTVVSDDREVAGGARQLGARAVGVAAFFAPPDRVEDERPVPRGSAGFSAEDFGLPDQVNLKHPPRDLRER